MKHIKRNIPVDIIKGWSMLTIVFFHISYDWCGYLPSLMGNSWNVAVFFIVGGFFLKEDTLAQPYSFIKRKCRSLYLPATIIYSLSILSHNVFVNVGWYALGECHPATGVPFMLYSIKDIFVGIIKVIFAVGSGELIMGAMWFLYTLIYAFIGLTVLYWIICRLVNDKKSRFWIMTIVLMAIAVISCVLSQNYGFTISRFSTAATSMFLIWWGMILNKKMTMFGKFDNPFYLLLSVIAFVHCVLMQKGDMAMANNKYQDLLQIVGCCTAVLYIWGYVGTKIKNFAVGKFLSLIGKESLYIMAFHILGFFICNSLLVRLGIIETGMSKGLHTFCLSDEWKGFFLTILYVAFGIIVPLFIIFVFRYLKKRLNIEDAKYSC